MAIATLIPSTYYVTDSSYLSVSDASNMYDDTDSTDYATVTNNRNATTSYYIYIRGFNFDAVPSNVLVNSITIKLKAYHSGGSTGTIYCFNKTTRVDSAGHTTALGTIAQVKTFTGTTIDWDTLKGYGSNFGIRINCKRSNKSVVSHIYIYGAEIDVDYDFPATITPTLTGSGTISPSTATQEAIGSSYTLTITPTNPATDTVTVKNNGTDVSSSLVAHGAGSTEDTVLGSYTLVSGSFSGSGASYFSGIVGKGHDGSTTTSNYYSGGSGTIAVFTYDMAFTNIPSNAHINRVYCLVNGHAESTSQSSEYMCAQLISGSTQLSEELNFKDVGTSNSTETLECTTIPTVSQLASMKLQCRLGYYGGAINGATCYVVWEDATTGIQYYTYTFTVSGAATISVTIGSESGPTLYLKVNGNWQVISKVYEKTRETVWTEITPEDFQWSSYFSTSYKYKKGN